MHLFFIFLAALLTTASAELSGNDCKNGSLIYYEYTHHSCHVGEVSNVVAKYNDYKELTKQNATNFVKDYCKAFDKVNQHFSRFVQNCTEKQKLLNKAKENVLCNFNASGSKPKTEITDLIDKMTFPIKLGLYCDHALFEPCLAGFVNVSGSTVDEYVKSVQKYFFGGEGFREGEMKCISEKAKQNKGKPGCENWRWEAIKRTLRDPNSPYRPAPFGVTFPTTKFNITEKLVEFFINE